MHIKIAEPIPHNAKELWYFVRTKSIVNKQAPWVESNEINEAPDIIKVPVDTYKKNGLLLYNETIRDVDAFYVTMYTIYNFNGKTIISAPHKRRIDRPLNAHIFWKVIKPIFGKSKLSIEIQPNRAFMRHPKLILCSCFQDQHLLSHTDSKAEIITEISEIEFDEPQKIYKKEYEISSTITKNRKLFLFEINHNSNENFSLKWANGFLGKV